MLRRKIKQRKGIRQCWSWDERFAVHRVFRKRAEGASLAEVWVQAGRKASADAVVGERLAYLRSNKASVAREE